MPPPTQARAASPAKPASSLKQEMTRRQRLMGPNAPIFYSQPLTLVRGKGVWLYDENGRKYLDAYNNVPHVGHCHPAVVKAAQRQMARLCTHTRYLSPEVLDYHELLLSKFPSPLRSVVLTCTGSEANDLALRIARLCTGQQGVIITDHTYHGNSTAVAEISSAYRSQALPDHVCCIRAPQGGSADAPADRAMVKQRFLDEVRQAIAELQRRGKGVAALLLEPIFSTDGLYEAPKGYIKEAVALVRDAGGLYIADEVQSGFGRLGKHWWGFQAHGVVPDLVTLGKSMGNGYPIGGVVGKQALIAQFREQVMYFNTFGANHVACAAGRAVLEVIDTENLMAQAQEVGSYLREQLRQLMVAHDCLGDVRGSGLFLGVELVSDRRRLTPDAAKTRAVVEQMKQAGVLVSYIGRHDNVLKLRPPMPFGMAHARQFVRTLDQVLTALR